MNIRRMFWYAALVGTAISVVVAPAPLRALGLTQDGRADEINLEQEKARTQALAAAEDEMVARRLATEVVYQQLVEGRMTLVEATTELEGVYHNSPTIPRFVREKMAGSTTRERFARWVIARAADTLKSDKTRRAEVLTRLELEYRVMTNTEYQPPTPDPAPPASPNGRVGRPDHLPDRHRHYIR